MSYQPDGAFRGKYWLVIGLLAVAGIAVAQAQPVDDVSEEIDPADGEADDDGTTPILCAGDGDAVDTDEEIDEFEGYDSDEYYVLDDDSDCEEDDFGTDNSVGYSSPAFPQVRDPGILPLVASGRRGGTSEPSAGAMLVAPARRKGASFAQDVPVPPLRPVDRPVPRSIGGQRVNDAEVPWQVQIFQPWTQAQLREWGMTTGGKSLWEFQHLCGATLVASNWALTAAHCLPPSAARTGYRVRLGAETIHDDGGYTYRIDRVVPFSTTAGPSANGVWRIHDITLIHFVDDRGIGRPPARQARPIAIDRGPVMADEDPVYATGWGRVSNRNSVPTSTMMKVSLSIVDNGACARGPWGPGFVHNLVMCAAAPGRQTCQGDSGGPLVNARGTPRLVGVVSWNNADCIGDVGRQGIYTRVASYARWIDQTIR